MTTSLFLAPLVRGVLEPFLPSEPRSLPLFVVGMLLMVEEEEESGGDKGMESREEIEEVEEVER